jgi:hypothetical protein
MDHHQQRWRGKAMKLFDFYRSGCRNDRWPATIRSDGTAGMDKNAKLRLESIYTGCKRSPAPKQES